MTRGPGEAERRSRALHVVSQRLPIVWERDLGFQRAPGGLVSALEPALHGRATTWFGDWRAPVAPVPPRGARYRLRGVPSTDREDRNALEGCCNRTLWPALHGLVDNVEQLADWWAGYDRRCERWADVLGAECTADGAVWLHDYHFFGVPHRLRSRRPDLRIALTVHTPVDSDGWRSMTHGEALLEQLAGCDVITVQSTDDAVALRHLLDDVGAPERVRVRSVPVGIDVDRWSGLRADPVVSALSRLHHRGTGLLAVGVDRLDYTKGVMPKLLALEVLLATDQLTSDEIRLVQIGSPTRQHVPSYSFLRHAVVGAVERINTSFPRADGLPVVQLFCEQWPAREVAGLMRAADIAVVTPVRDGMNLVAAEFAVVNADRPTDVLLGRGANVVEHLGPFCDVVDGRDVLGIAEALRRLVREPSARRAAQAARRGEAAARLRSDVWAERCLAALDGDSCPPTPVAAS